MSSEETKKRGVPSGGPTGARGAASSSQPSQKRTRIISDGFGPSSAPPSTISRSRHEFVLQHKTSAKDVKSVGDQQTAYDADERMPFAQEADVPELFLPDFQMLDVNCLSAHMQSSLSPNALHVPPQVAIYFDAMKRALETERRTASRPKNCILKRCREGLTWKKNCWISNDLSKRKKGHSESAYGNADRDLFSKSPHRKLKSSLKKG